MTKPEEEVTAAATEEFLAAVLVKGGLVGKVRSQKQIDDAFLKMLDPQYHGTLHDRIVDLIDFENPYQDLLYGEADQVVMDSILIDEEDDGLRAALSRLLDDKLTTLTQVFEVILYGGPPAEEE